MRQSIWPTMRYQMVRMHSCTHASGIAADRVFTPRVGDVVDATIESHIYQVTLSDPLMCSLLFQPVKDAELSWLDGKITFQPVDAPSTVDGGALHGESQVCQMRCGSCSCRYHLMCSPVRAFHHTLPSSSMILNCPISNSCYNLRASRLNFHWVSCTLAMSCRSRSWPPASLRWREHCVMIFIEYGMSSMLNLQLCNYELGTLWRR